MELAEESNRYALLRVPELRRELARRSLDQLGTKRELVQRLVASDEAVAREAEARQAPQPSVPPERLARGGTDSEGTTADPAITAKREAESIENGAFAGGCIDVDVDEELQQGLERLLGGPEDEQGAELLPPAETSAGDSQNLLDGLEAEPLAPELLLHARRAHCLRELLTDGVCERLGVQYEGLLGSVSASMADVATCNEVTTDTVSSFASDAHKAFASSLQSDVSLNQSSISAYSHPAATLVLLRTYASQGRWVSTVDGVVTFEDDSVQYPADTLTLVRENSGEPLLVSLISLWLLVAFRDNYEIEATPDVCERLGASRIYSQHLPELLDFLFGKCERCSLVSAPPADFPRPRPSLLPSDRRPSAQRRAPLAAEELCKLPMAVTQKSSPQPVAQRLAKLRRDIAERKSRSPCGAKALVSAGGRVASLRAEAATASRRSVVAEAALARLEGEEALVTRLLDDIGRQLDIVTRELGSASARGRRLQSELESGLAALNGDGAAESKGAAKRPRRAAMAGDTLLGELLAL